MKRIIITIALLTLIAASAASIAQAQDEITLEGIAGQLAALVRRVEAIDERLGSFEIFLSDSGPAESYENGCLIGVDAFAAMSLDLDSLRDEAVLKYKEKFDEWLVLTNVKIDFVMVNSETGHVGITYKVSPYRYMAEEWDGCDLVKSTDWWEE